MPLLRRVIRRPRPHSPGVAHVRSDDRTHVEQLLEGCLDLPVAERELFLRQVCGADGGCASDCSACSRSPSTAAASSGGRPSAPKAMRPRWSRASWRRARCSVPTASSVSSAAAAWARCTAPRRGVQDPTPPKPQPLCSHAEHMRGADASLHPPHPKVAGALPGATHDLPERRRYGWVMRRTSKSASANRSMMCSTVGPPRSPVSLSARVPCSAEGVV
jgi:hypothetical protein